MALATVEMEPGTRAVERIVAAGDTATCAHCEGHIGFRARKRYRQIIANVYIHINRRGHKRTARPGTGGIWHRVEHWHPECYEAMGQPYGEPDVYIPTYRALR